MNIKKKLAEISLFFLNGGREVYCGYYKIENDYIIINVPSEGALITRSLKRIDRYLIKELS